MPQVKKDFPECDNCCACCCTSMVEYFDHNKKALEFMRVRAFKEVIYGTRHIFYSYEPCPKLDEETGMCTIYDTRPEVCREFPTERKIDSDWCHICARARKLKADRKRRGPVFKVLKLK